MKLGRTQEMSSISNMPIDRAGVTMDGTDEYVWDVYQKSVKMSTYLVAFVVSKFSYVEAEKRANNVRFRIWSQPSTLDQTAYAKEMGPKMLEFFENYFFSSVHLSLMKSQARYRPRVFLPTPPSTFLNTIKFRNFLLTLLTL